MKKTYWSFLCVFLLLLTVHPSFAQNKIPYSVIGSGGSTSSNGSFILSGTIGQSFTGISSNASNGSNAGFWYLYFNDVVTSADDEEGIIPNVFRLEQNYPNPFNPSTVIKFGVPEKSNVVIKIYDILGSEVTTLVDEQLDAGWYKKNFNASALSTGVYIYRMNAGKFVNTKKMLMIK